MRLVKDTRFWMISGSVLLVLTGIIALLLVIKNLQRPEPRLVLIMPDGKPMYLPAGNPLRPVPFTTRLLNLTNAPDGSRDFNIVVSNHTTEAILYMGYGKSVIAPEFTLEQAFQTGPRRQRVTNYNLGWTGNNISQYGRTVNQLQGYSSLTFPAHLPPGVSNVALRIHYAWPQTKMETWKETCRSYLGKPSAKRTTISFEYYLWPIAPTFSSEIR